MKNKVWYKASMFLLAAVLVFGMVPVHVAMAEDVSSTSTTATAPIGSGSDEKTDSGSGETPVPGTPTTESGSATDKEKAPTPSPQVPTSKALGTIGATLTLPDAWADWVQPTNDLGTVLAHGSTEVYGNGDYNYSSSDNKVATITTYGYLTWIDTGTVTITATSVDNPSQTSSVTFTAIASKDYQNLAYAYVSMSSPCRVGDQGYLYMYQYITLPNDEGTSFSIDSTAFTWISTDPAVAQTSVDEWGNQIVTVKGAGTTTLIGTFDDDSSAKITTTFSPDVYEAPNAYTIFSREDNPSGGSIYSSDNFSMDAGTERDLYALPQSMDDSYVDGVSWTTSNPDVASFYDRTVDDGNKTLDSIPDSYPWTNVELVGKSAGTATITAHFYGYSSDDGYDSYHEIGTDTITVTVTDAPGTLDINGIWDGSYALIGQNTSIGYVLGGGYTYRDIKNVQWVSSDPSILSVTALSTNDPDYDASWCAANIIGVSGGTANVTVTVTFTDGSTATQSVSVDVEQPNPWVQWVQPTNNLGTVLAQGAVNISGYLGSYSYRSLNPSVATIDYWGNLTWLSSGTVTVQATNDDNPLDTQQATFTAQLSGDYASLANVDVSGSYPYQVGSACDIYVWQDNITVPDPDGGWDYLSVSIPPTLFKWTSSNASVATTGIDAEGNPVVIVKGSGTTTITGTLKTDSKQEISTTFSPDSYVASDKYAIYAYTGDSSQGSGQGLDYSTNDFSMAAGTQTNLYLLPQSMDDSYLTTVSWSVDNASVAGFLWWDDDGNQSTVSSTSYDPDAYDIWNTSFVFLAAKSAGTATVTAHFYGYDDNTGTYGELGTSTIKVTVTDATGELELQGLVENGISCKVGADVYAGYWLGGGYTYRDIKDLQWSSSDPSILTISNLSPDDPYYYEPYQVAKATGRGTGPVTVTLTVNFADGTKASQSVTTNVSDYMPFITVNGKLPENDWGTLNLVEGGSATLDIASCTYVGESDTGEWVPISPDKLVDAPIESVVWESEDPDIAHVEASGATGAIVSGARYGYTWLTATITYTNGMVVEVSNDVEVNAPADAHSKDALNSDGYNLKTIENFPLYTGSEDVAAVICGHFQNSETSSTWLTPDSTWDNETGQDCYRIAVNGQQLEPSDYEVDYLELGDDTDTVSHSDYVIRLTPAYLATLINGNYLVTVEFTGWVDTPNVYKDLSTTITLPLTVAVSGGPEKTPTTVTLDLGGGTATGPTSIAANVGDTFADIGGVPAAPTRTGYKFDGWNTAADGSGEMVTASTVITANMVLYAQWTAEPPASYTITYNLSGGTNPASAPLIYTAGTSTALPTPTKAGYLFKGWYDNAAYTGNAITAIGSANTGNCTFWAKWAANVTASTIKLPASSYVYTGSAIKPVPTVTSGTTTLVSGTDYTVSYGTNTAVGSGTVTVTSMGDLTNTATVTFSIVPATPKLASLNRPGFGREFCLSF